MQRSDAAFPPELRSSVEKSLVCASRIAPAQFRLDAPAFLSQDQLLALMPGTSKAQSLSRMADVFTVYIQSPILAYVTPFAHSRPYMTTSELAEYQQYRRSHVSLLADPRLIGWEIKAGNIVVSRSGRVGESYWVDRKLDGVLVGDSFRVLPKMSADAPFIYAVLSSSFARNFLSGSAYGSVVDHASLDQLRSFPIPEVTEALKSEITQLVARALAARESAYQLLDEAQRMLFDVCGLKPMTEELDDTSESDVLSVFVTSAELAQAEVGAPELRLEAHFHNPTVRTILANLKQARVPRTTVKKLTDNVFFCNRFTRTFVKAGHGIPYVAGKNIVQTRPRVEHYLSVSETEELEAYKLHQGWTLITCSGTIGRTCFVWDNFEKYVATHDLIRVVANPSAVDPAYLYAFLSSPYGYEQILRFRHGSVIDHVTPDQIAKVIVPIPSPSAQSEIGDHVRFAYEKRAEALRLEEKAQGRLMGEIRGTAAKESETHV